MTETLFDITTYTRIIPVPVATIAKPVISSTEIPLPEFNKIQTITSLNYIEVFCCGGYKNSLCENLKLLRLFDKCIVNFDKDYFRRYIQNFIDQLNKAYPHCSELTIDVDLKIYNKTFKKVGTEIYFKPIQKSIMK